MATKKKAPAQKKKGKSSPRKTGTPRRFTKQVMKQFCVLYAELGTPTEAAKALGFSRVTYNRYYAEDPEFAKMCDEAEQQFRDKVFREVIRRGVEGWEEPVFGSLEGMHSGSGQIGTIHKYSDRMLDLAMRKVFPEMRGNNLSVDAKTQHSGVVGTVGGNVDTSKLTKEEKMALLMLLDKMAPEEDK